MIIRERIIRMRTALYVGEAPPTAAAPVPHRSYGFPSLLAHSALFLPSPTICIVRDVE